MLQHESSRQQASRQTTHKNTTGKNQSIHEKVTQPQRPHQRAYSGLTAFNARVWPYKFTTTYGCDENTASICPNRLGA